MSSRQLHLTEPEFQIIMSKIYEADDLTLILQRLDEADALQADPSPAHVATLTQFIRQRLQETVALLNGIEARTFSPAVTKPPAPPRSKR